MKKSNRTIKYIVAMPLLAIAILGCASTVNKEGSGEYFDDSVVTAKVISAIFSDPNLKTAEINVETFKGVVQLSGFVNNKTSVSKATEVAKGVKGVISVKNDLRLK